MLEPFGDLGSSRGKPRSNLGGFCQDRHAAVQGDDDEIHQDSEAREPQAGAIAVDDDQQKQWDVAQQDQSNTPGGRRGRHELGADLKDETKWKKPPVVEVDIPQVDHSSPAQDRDGHR